jgi:hypothetical protein
VSTVPTVHFPLPTTLRDAALTTFLPTAGVVA